MPCASSTDLKFETSVPAIPEIEQTGDSDKMISSKASPVESIK